LQARPENRNDGEDKHDVRDDLEQFGHAHEHFVDPAAEPRRRGTDCDADERRGDAGGQTDQQRCARPMDDQRRDIATQHVSAERIPPRFERPCFRWPDNSQRIDGIKKVCQHRGKHDQREDHRTDQRSAIARESPEKSCLPWPSLRLQRRLKIEFVRGSHGHSLIRGSSRA
jgi:hypothetical protein